METFMLIGVGELSAPDDGDMKSSLCDGDGAALMSNGVGAADNTAFDGVRLVSLIAFFRGIASALSLVVGGLRVRLRRRFCDEIESADFGVFVRRRLRGAVILCERIIGVRVYGNHIGTIG